MFLHGKQLYVVLINNFNRNVSRGHVVQESFFRFAQYISLVWLFVLLFFCCFIMSENFVLIISLPHPSCHEKIN